MDFFDVPVLFLAFNRPETTRRVFDAIRQARPAQLFIAADGPRQDRPDEIGKCAETRETVSAIDWPCDVKTLFREHNLGCRKAVSSAIDWFFDHVEEGIILEDDCLPHPDFFRFCREMLEFHRDDHRVMHISGTNFQGGIKRGNASYYFSRYAHIWGWATWRRAWRFYDVDMKSFPEFKISDAPRQVFPIRRERKRWLEILEKVYRNDVVFRTWDFQWSYALFKENCLAVTPNVNLVSNIGFGTGTHASNSKYANLPYVSIEEELTHPDELIPNTEADKMVFNEAYANSNLFYKIKNLFHR